MLDAISAAERSIRPEGAPGTDQPPSGTRPRELTAPLGQPLELDRPEPGGREQSVERFEAADGSIPLQLVSKDIDRAPAALNAHPRALGAALLVTEDALRQVHRNNRLEPKDWTSVRTQVLQGYALALDSRPGAPKQLTEAQRALSAMPGGEPFVQRLAALQAAPARNPAALSALVRDLDATMRSLREAAQVAH